MPNRPTNDLLKALRGTPLQRLAPVLRETIDVATRTAEVAFSSEFPVERYFGIEVLDHDPKSVRLDRLLDGGAVLVQHDPDRQIGVIDTARIDPDRRGRARLRFSRSPEADAIFQDVVDGIRRHVSVGYRVHDLKLEQSGDDGDRYRVTDWEPIEVSLVSVPADPTASVGRSLETTAGVSTMSGNQTKEAPRSDDQTVEPKTPITEQRAEPKAEPKPAPKAERRDVDRIVVDDRIRAIGKHFGLEREAEDAIVLGSSVEDWQAQVRKLKADRFEPTPAKTRVESVPLAGRVRKLRAYSNDRAGEEAAYRDGMWIKAQLLGDAQARQWVEQNYTRVMQGGIQSKGGALVPEQMLQTVIDLREEYGVARQLCRVVPMASDTLILPRRTASTTAYFIGEADSITASDAGFDTIQLVARKLGAISLVSSDLMEDSVVDLADWLAMDIAMQFASKEDACFIDGDGTSTYGGIYGLRPKIINGNHTAGAIDAASNHDVLTEIDVDDLSGVVGKLPLYAKRNAKWLCSPLANALIFDALKVAGGGNTATDLSGRPRQTWWGDPIVISPAMPGATATTDYSNVAMLFYGDFMQACVFGDRREIRVKVDESRYLEYDQIAIQSTERFDIVNHGLGDTSTAGPLVALIGE